MGNGSENSSSKFWIDLSESDQDIMVATKTRLDIDKNHGQCMLQLLLVWLE